MAVLLPWLILSVMLGATIVFYQLGIRREQVKLSRVVSDIMAELRAARTEQKEVERRIEVEMRSLGHKMNNITNGMVMIATMEGKSWSPESEDECH